MICPECGAEYEYEILECEDCEVPLVEAVEDEEESEFAPLVESTDVTYFSLVTARLEEEGIPWFVQGEKSRGALPRDGWEQGRMGDEVATIYVTEKRFREARQLVRDLDPVSAGPSFREGSRRSGARRP